MLWETPARVVPRREKARQGVVSKAKVHPQGKENKVVRTVEAVAGNTDKAAVVSPQAHHKAAVFRALAAGRRAH